MERLYWRSFSIFSCLEMDGSFCIHWKENLSYEKDIEATSYRLPCFCNNRYRLPTTVFILPRSNTGRKYGACQIVENIMNDYVSGNALQPISRHYLYFKLVNLVFTKNGDNVKVKVAVISLDNQTWDTQVAQYELMLYKDSNWKIVG